jgi:hypothetical protein
LNELASISPYSLTKTRPVPNAAVTVPQIKNTPDTPALEALSNLETPAPEVMTIPETPPPAPEPSFILQEVLLEVPEAKPKFLKSSAVVSVNSVKIQNKNEKDAYAAFKPVPAVPEDHVYSAVDFMTAPTPAPPAGPPAPPAVFSRAQEMVPIFDEDIDSIASVPEVRIDVVFNLFVTSKNEFSNSLIHEFKVLQSVFKIKNKA